MIISVRPRKILCLVNLVTSAWGQICLFIISHEKNVSIFILLNWIRERNLIPWYQNMEQFPSTSKEKYFRTPTFLKRFSYPLTSGPLIKMKARQGIVYNIGKFIDNPYRNNLWVVKPDIIIVKPNCKVI